MPTQTARQKISCRSPPLTPHEQEIARRIHKALPAYCRKTKRTKHTKDQITKAAEELLKPYTKKPAVRTDLIQNTLINHIFGWGKLEPLRLDTDIEDISCTGWEHPVYIYHRKHRDCETDIRFESETELDTFVTLFAQRAGKQISNANPIIDASLEDGSRIQLTYGRTVSPNGSGFTIRKFKNTPYSVIDLIKNRTFTIDEMVYLWFAIEYNRSILIIGETASGKTTTLNALTQFIPELAKIVTIEDTRELMLDRGNWQASVVPPENGKNTITLFDLVTAAMRQRPEYLIVGEVRGKETAAMFQAINTGHTSLSTFHAGNLQSAVNRLESPPLSISKAMIDSLDIVIVQKRTAKNGTPVRRCSAILEVCGGRNHEVFTYRKETDDAETKKSILENEIREESGLSREAFAAEKNRRRHLLKQLLDAEISGFRAVTEALNP